jgi:hypothetical protein
MGWKLVLMAAAGLTVASCATAPTGSAPQLDKITLRDTVGRYHVIYPSFFFHDADGDVNSIHREILSSTGVHGRFNPISRISIDPAKQRQGAVYVGEWQCGPNPSTTTVRAYLTDRQGNRSNTLDYTIVCKGTDDLGQ